MTPDKTNTQAPACRYCLGTMEPDTDWTGGVQKYFFVCEGCRSRTPHGTSRESALYLANHPAPVVTGTQAPGPTKLNMKARDFLYEMSATLRGWMEVDEYAMARTSGLLAKVGAYLTETAPEALAALRATATINPGKGFRMLSEGDPIHSKVQGYYGEPGGWMRTGSEGAFYSAALVPMREPTPTQPKGTEPPARPGDCIHGVGLCTGSCTKGSK